MDLHMRKLRGIVLAVSLMLCASLVRAGVYEVKPGAPNQVVFTSKATAETFQGRTDRLTGRITLDPAQVTDSVTVYMEVDLTTLDTGLGKRDQHMRENHLETKKYPKAIFKGATLRGAGARPLVAGTPAQFDVEGAFTLHGVTRRMRATVEVVLKDDKTLQFKTEFPVGLADYKIDRPKFLFLKLADVQQVAVTGTAILAP
jgi:polyisoprenoid-binding protein YceI